MTRAPHPIASTTKDTRSAPGPVTIPAALVEEEQDRVQATGDTGQRGCRRMLSEGGVQPVAPTSARPRSVS
jgi:hypothetical protein